MPADDPFSAGIINCRHMSEADDNVTRMAHITPEYIDEQIGYLRDDHEFYIVYGEEFGGDESDLPELRRLLRSAAAAVGVRVHTRVHEHDAVWVYDPDWNPTAEEREAIRVARVEAADAQLRGEQQENERSALRPVRHLRAVD